MDNRETSSLPSIKCTPDQVARAVRQIFSAYRKAEYADAEGYVAQLGTILETYPPSVVSHVSGPHTGIQRKLKWPPQIAEIVEACDARLEHEQAIARLAVLPRAKLRQRYSYTPSPEEQERVKVGFQNLLQSLRKTNIVGGKP